MRKIILLCAAGMSTSMLVKKMFAAADAAGYACEMAAYSMNDAAAKASNADLILLGPQVRFAKSKVEAACPGVPVEPIDMRMYGSMDGKGILEAAKAKLGD